LSRKRKEKNEKEKPSLLRYGNVYNIKIESAAFTFLRNILFLKCPEN
jgi:hypothetical protein